LNTIVAARDGSCSTGWKMVARNFPTMWHFATSLLIGGQQWERRCHSGKRYRIHHGNGANVIELDDAALPRTGWCFVPGDHLVAGDVVLAQKIALETDERGALASANNFTPR
jgi:hypothetical protein